ncbi:MAG: CoA transferase, partial [Alphaproteobacteria bacterium]|nr:CoA transferase [Alphaproteobacteria bacterium]
PIYPIDQMFADPQVEHVGIAQQKDGAGPRYVGQPVVLTRTPSRIAAHPPAAGEHTDEILRDLGYDAAAIADMRKRRVV